MSVHAPNVARLLVNLHSRAIYDEPTECDFAVYERAQGGHVASLRRLVVAKPQPSDVRRGVVRRWKSTRLNSSHSGESRMPSSA